eukprot:GHVS01083528.1.p1 GENE.GHVS01083528.1~~GHVS01083528.1.p1  ORF type:complete len:361 (-),score=98.03 GHVS01083528.1:977-2059(-)
MFACCGKEDKKLRLRLFVEEAEIFWEQWERSRSYYSLSISPPHSSPPDRPMTSWVVAQVKSVGGCLTKPTRRGLLKRKLLKTLTALNDDGDDEKNKSDRRKGVVEMCAFYSWLEVDLPPTVKQCCIHLWCAGKGVDNGQPSVDNIMSAEEEVEEERCCVAVGELDLACGEEQVKRVWLARWKEEEGRSAVGCEKEVDKAVGVGLFNGGFIDIQIDREREEEEEKKLSPDEILCTAEAHNIIVDLNSLPQGAPPPLPPRSADTRMFKMIRPDMFPPEWLLLQPARTTTTRDSGGHIDWTIWRHLNSLNLTLCRIRATHTVQDEGGGGLKEDANEPQQQQQQQQTKSSLPYGNLDGRQKDKQ